MGMSASQARLGELTTRQNDIKMSLIDLSEDKMSLTRASERITKNYRDALKKQIEAVDSEIARCEKSLKGWKVATVLGSVGAVASGIGIIAQSHQIKENKKVVDKISADAKEATETLEFIKKVQE